MLVPLKSSTRLLPRDLAARLFDFMAGLTPVARAQVSKEIIHIDPTHRPSLSALLGADVWFRAGSSFPSRELS